MATMHAAAMRADLRIEAVQSLKAKRHVVKSVVSRLVKTYRVSVSEVDHHDLWQRATLGIAVVANSPGQVRRILHTVERDLRADERIEVLATAVSFLEDPP